MEEVYLTFATTVAFILVATEFLKNLLNTEGFSTQAVSWLTGITIVMFGWWASIGWLTEVELWWHAAIWGFGASLAANGVFDVPIIKTILTTIFAFLRK